MPRPALIDVLRSFLLKHRPLLRTHPCSSAVHECQSGPPKCIWQNQRLHRSKCVMAGIMHGSSHEENALAELRRAAYFFLRLEFLERWCDPRILFQRLFSWPAIEQLFLPVFQEPSITIIKPIGVCERAEYAAHLVTSIIPASGHIW